MENGLQGCRWNMNGTEKSVQAVVIVTTERKGEAGNTVKWQPGPDPETVGCERVGWEGPGAWTVRMTRWWCYH